MHPNWARQLRDQCVDTGTPFFFKQHGEYVNPEDFSDTIRWSGALHQFPDGQIVWRVGKTAAGRVLDGRTWDQYPPTEGS